MSDLTLRAQTVKRNNEKSWLALHSVVSVGIGNTADGSLGIIVSVAESPDEIRNLIPEMIDGIPIEIVTTGRLRAF
jgi:hypothetical protein